MNDLRQKPLKLLAQAALAQLAFALCAFRHQFFWGGDWAEWLHALEVLGLADAFGNSRIPLYVLNVTYPLVDEEVVSFCAGKRAVLLVEEGQPDFIEQALNTVLRRADVQTRLHGKDVLPMAGEYTGGVLTAGVARFVERVAPELLAGRPLPRAARLPRASSTSGTPLGADRNA